MKKDFKNIIEGCIRNDRTFQEKLYKLFFPTMISMTLRFTKDRNEAMMIVNDGFMKVFKNIKSFESRGSLEGWIRKIVYHSISDYFKKESKHLNLLVLEDFDYTNDRNVIDKLFEADILDLINKIPKASAQVFKLYVLEGYSHKEIARKNNISVGTSKWHLSEARKRLQKLITDLNTNHRHVVG